MRPKALLNLLNSVKKQSLYPNQILIIDGSTDSETKQSLEINSFKNLTYYQVNDHQRGLTKQRNFGISQVEETIDIVCFLDDDITLDKLYFKNLLSTYAIHHKALGVGGYITNEVFWEISSYTKNINYFYFDGWRRKEPSRFKIRRSLGLAPDMPPAFLPTFSHMRAIGFLPPNNKIYPVELFMGGVASYRKSVFNSLSFSTYFEGYGLYEDADYCLRLSKLGPLYVNTSARCEHHHEIHGRPNAFKYGKMVLRNGWYIWRVKYKNPKLKARLKWHLTAFLLMLLTLLGGIKSMNRNSEIQETIGRIVGWWGVVLNKPKIKT